jgi:hypothetical protein
MNYLKVILRKLILFNNSQFEVYVLEKEFSVPVIRRSYRG